MVLRSEKLEQRTKKEPINKPRRTLATAMVEQRKPKRSEGPDRSSHQIHYKKGNTPDQDLSSQWM